MILKSPAAPFKKKKKIKNYVWSRWCTYIKLGENSTKIASKGRVLSPHGALMVFPCIGSQTQVTICPALRTALIKWGSLTLWFSAPILQIIVILPGLLLGFKISMRLTRSLGSILLLTCIQMFGFSHQILLEEIKLLQLVSGITKRRIAYFVCNKYNKIKPQELQLRT